MQLGMTLTGAGRYEEAVASFRRAGDLAPMMFQATIHLGLVFNHLGRSDEAIAPLEVAVTTSGRHPWTLAALAVCYSSLGKLADVEAIWDELVARARREHLQPTVLAIVAASLGRMDETFDLLERACDEHDGILVYSKRYPFFRQLQADPRMARIYRRIGFPDGASYGASSTSP
jgi:tetratricopeptide (TPR) repeat protein